MSAPAILQLRIELLDIQPPVWRRIRVPGHYTFWDLHIAIQSAFGWNDSHLHEFQVRAGRRGERCFGIPMESFFKEAHMLPDWEYRVADDLSLAHPRLAYNYDFGDGWQHAVILEDILPPAPGKKYPRCTAGERAGPPDDCGGPGGYASRLAVLADPGHEDYASSHAWAASIKGIAGKFDPEAFDEQRVKFANPGPRSKRLMAGMR